MKILSAKIINYKSFKETQEFSFTDGFNIIVGQNNVGKTAMIEAISLTFKGNPHKSIEQKRGATYPTSSVECILSLKKDEINDLLLANGRDIYLPLGELSRNAHEAQRIYNEVLGAENLILGYQANAQIGNAGSLSVIASSIRALCKTPPDYPSSEPMGDVNKGTRETAMCP